MRRQLRWVVSETKVRPRQAFVLSTTALDGVRTDAWIGADPPTDHPGSQPARSRLAHRPRKAATRHGVPGNLASKARPFSITAPRILSPDSENVVPCVDESETYARMSLPPVVIDHTRSLIMLAAGIDCHMDTCDRGHAGHPTKSAQGTGPAGKASRVPAEDPTGLLVSNRSVASDLPSTSTNLRRFSLAFRP
jgi:hypothetical protein